ncbi:putative membrane protein [Clostridiales bacterium oral taxon 876 str. F0540]|nr:putative membrane protein [Clostridiales bacterium oral taxon 876 str. F0540]
MVMERVKGRKTLAADSALLLVAVFWGGGFVAVKDAVTSITPFYMIGIRFLLSSLILGIIFFKKVKNLTKKDIKIGTIVGVFLFLAFAAQTAGAQYTTAGKQAFLTGTNVVIVPFLAWLIYKHKPDIYSAAASILVLIGIGLLTLKEGFAINFGDALTLACALFFAIHITCLGYFAKKTDTIILTVTQMAAASLMAFICAFIFEPPLKNIPKEAAGSMVYIVIFSTMLAFFIQTTAQKYTTESHAAIILCLESVFGSILAVIFLGDVFTKNMIIGCILIFSGILISETKLQFLKKNIRGCGKCAK